MIIKSDSADVGLLGVNPCTAVERQDLKGQYPVKAAWP